jgi:hypothetical protein
MAVKDKAAREAMALRLAPLVTELVQIFDEVKACVETEPKIGFFFTSITERMAQGVMRRIDEVVDRRTGLEFAARQIGVCAASLEGYEALHILCQKLHDLRGPDAGNWMDCRLNGVTAYDGQIWYN